LPSAVVAGRQNTGVVVMGILSVNVVPTAKADTAKVGKLDLSDAAISKAEEAAMAKCQKLAGWDESDDVALAVIAGLLRASMVAGFVGKSGLRERSRGAFKGQCIRELESALKVSGEAAKATVAFLVEKGILSGYWAGGPAICWPEFAPAKREAVDAKKVEAAASSFMERLAALRAAANK